jgi:hypothetical protein
LYFLTGVSNPFFGVFVALFAAFCAGKKRRKNRRSQRGQRPLADYASQGGGKQAQRS